MIPRPMLEVLGMVSSLVEVLSLPGFPMRHRLARRIRRNSTWSPERPGGRVLFQRLGSCRPQGRGPQPRQQMANTLAGKPLPPRGLGQEATTAAPDSGSPSRLAISSICQRPCSKT